jgi:hypothetical protein
MPKCYQDDSLYGKEYQQLGNRSVNYLLSDGIFEYVCSLPLRVYYAPKPRKCSENGGAIVYIM